MRKRKPIKMKPLPKILIVSEGRVTEVLYVEGVRRERRIQKERVRLFPGAGVPMSVVETAVRVKTENEQLNLRDGIDIIDHVWAVFDRDDHPQIPQAKAKAKANGVEVAFTNPCIELFLLLHFVTIDRDEHRNQVARLLKTHIPNYDKHFDYDALELTGKYATARLRAERINTRSRLVNGIESAPFCSMIRLVDYLRKM